MKVKIKSRKLEQKQDDVCETPVNEMGQQELDEAWYDAVKAGAQALNPLKGVTQKVGKFVQDARGASLEADAKRQITELVKLMDSVAPKFQQLADRAAKLYGGDMKHPMVGAILGIKRNITTHRNALQSLTTKPLLQQGGNAQSPQQNPATKPAGGPATSGTTSNPAAAGTTSSQAPQSSQATTTQTSQTAVPQSANPAAAGTTASGAKQEPTTPSSSGTQQSKTAVDRSNQATPSNLGTNRPSVKNMPPLKNPKDEEAYKRLIAMRDSGKKLDANQQKRLQQLMQMKLQQEPAQSGKPKPKIQTPDFTTNDKTRKSTGV